MRIVGPSVALASFTACAPEAQFDSLLADRERRDPNSESSTL